MGIALEEPNEDDVKIVDVGIRVYLDRRVADWFKDGELSFETDAWGGGFTFNHPDIGTC